MTNDLITGPFLVYLISKLKIASTLGIKSFPSPRAKKLAINPKISSAFKATSFASETSTLVFS